MQLRTPLPSAALETACEALVARRMVVLDCEETGYPGVLCAAAATIDDAQVNFMARDARGLIALALPLVRCAELELPLIQRRGEHAARQAYTVSIEAHEGVSTGISAGDRAHTMRVAADPTSRPGDLVRPGHVFPVQANHADSDRPAGHIEVSLELLRLAGLPPAAAVCAILDDDGDVAGRDAVRAFCARHGLPLVRAADVLGRAPLTQRAGDR